MTLLIAHHIRIIGPKDGDLPFASRLKWEALRLARWAHVTCEGGGTDGDDGRSARATLLLECLAQAGIIPERVLNNGWTAHHIHITCIECNATADLGELWRGPLHDMLCKLRELHKSTCSYMYSSVDLEVEQYCNNEEGMKIIFYKNILYLKMTIWKNHVL